MKNTDKLIQLYFYICELYDRELCLHYQRMSNNYSPKLSDQEVLTIYFFGLTVEKRKTKKEIYDFADNYLRSWFPDLGTTYESYLGRINNLVDVFPPIIAHILEQQWLEKNTDEFCFFGQQIINVVDSMPIVLAKGFRRFSAKVAPELCDKGFCSSKNLSYYGLKFHFLGFARKGQLPQTEKVFVSPASNNDLTVMKPVFERLFDRAIYADKIYANKAWQEWLIEHNNLEILTPVKLKKGQKELDYKDKLYSKAVSSIRQPVEAFFAWIIDQVGIQNASKVRSSKGLMVHVFGRFAAALMIAHFDFL
ncbi:MAG: transposase [Bacteroidota bacterium]